MPSRRSRRSNRDANNSALDRTHSNNSSSKVGTGHFTNKLKNIDTTSTQLLFKEKQIFNIKTNAPQAVREQQYQDEYNNYMDSKQRHYILQGTKSSQGQSIVSITAASPTPSQSMYGATPSQSVNQISYDDRGERQQYLRISPNRIVMQG